MKLNEEHPMVAAFTSPIPGSSSTPAGPWKSWIRPPRRRRSSGPTASPGSHEGPHGAKKEGKLILVFPAGTRFRPWEPETKRGVREIDSYIKSFDYMCLVSNNGAVLRIQQGKMTEDQVVPTSSTSKPTP
jgi:glycerol-3-phosphate O-acyltransferase